ILFDIETKIDLIILDVMMPRMDGYQVLEKIRASNNLSSRIPVIMLTAKAQKEDVVKGIQKCASDYILKPYKFHDLLAKIKKFDLMG
ncbi:MAG: response regulator, partial [Desulfobacula sp.]|nr:response regulator [Desulfobacula sp.]